MAKNYKILKIILVIACWSCGEPPAVDLPENTRCIDAEGCAEDYIATVCHNPESIWHLEECIDEGEQCMKFDRNNDAYCLAITERMCQVPREMQSDFLRSACGYHYHNMAR